MENCAVPQRTLRRLPLYLNYLRSLEELAPQFISSKAIADALDLNHVQVRKDLAMVCSLGKPKVGYQTERLIQELEKVLGWDGQEDAVVVGSGQWKQVFLSDGLFETYGLRIIAGFDPATPVTDCNSSGKPLLPLKKLEDFCEQSTVRVGIIATPKEQAQSVCNRLVACGVKAIWNFSPIHLRVPDEVWLQSEYAACSLAMISNHLKHSS